MLMVTSMSVCGQDSLSLYDKVFNLPDKLFGAIHRKSDKFQQNVIKSTTKYINKLERQEMKMKRRLARTDSTKAEEVFGDVKGRYGDMREVLNSPAGKLQKAYSRRIDSMKTSLGFLNNMKVFDGSGEMQSKVQGILKDYNGAQNGLNQVDLIQKQLQERKKYLMTRLQSFPLGKSFTEFKKTVYYYRAQMDEYKRVFESPAKLESALLASVVKVPAFTRFFAKYSELGQIFRLPGNDDFDAASVNAMQTRAMLMEQIGSRLPGGSNTQQMVSSSLSGAQSSLQGLKNKLNSMQSNGDPDMPGFKPNTEKTKSFLDRIEMGINIQSTKNSYFLPILTDIAVSAGYKFNSKITAGIGVSYKMGWGDDIRHIKISHQGVGLRIYQDIKLKGNFWFSSGGEMNFHSQFNNFEELKNHSPNYKSVLAGFSKKYKIKKYNGELRILYDFLWNRNGPASSPIIFRTGYNF